MGTVIILLYNIFSAPYIKISKEEREVLENTIFMDLTSGQVVIELYPKIAPMHVARIKELVRSNFYNGAPWHRVINEFIAQCCDRGEILISPELSTLEMELSELSHIRGAVSMARGQEMNSATNQFFVVLKDSRFLDGKYTVFGFVREGMELIDNLRRGNIARNDLVEDPDVVISMRMAIDDVIERAISEKKIHFINKSVKGIR